MSALSGLGAAAGQVDGTRFAAVSQLPTYAAALFVALLVAAGAPADPVDFGLAFERLEELSAAGALLLAAAILLLAVVLHPLQLPLVRLLEGYWPGRLGQALARVGVRRQERLRGRAAEATAVGEAPTADEAAEALAAAWSLRRRFPPEGVPLLPTALGNALRAMEATAGAAYGAETVTWWPRLYGVLGSTAREVVDDRRTQLDVACRLSATAAVVGAVTVPLLARSGWWLALALAPLALAWVAYRAAVAAAVAYGEAVRAAFDLHRFDLLAALHLPLPATPARERRLNERLSRFWDQGVPLDDIGYEHADRAAER